MREVEAIPDRKDAKPGWDEIQRRLKRLMATTTSLRFLAMMFFLAMTLVIALEFYVGFGRRGVVAALALTILGAAARSAGSHLRNWAVRQVAAAMFAREAVSAIVSRRPDPALTRPLLDTLATIIVTEMGETEEFASALVAAAWQAHPPPLTADEFLSRHSRDWKEAHEKRMGRVREILRQIPR